ncbi:MAG: glycosyl hydrolase [Syntrophomonas sp.]|nr:glycosyl hydrolase [Syntrophomonas sp.]
MSRYLLAVLLALILLLPGSTAMDAEDMEKFHKQSDEVQAAVATVMPERVSYYNSLDGYRIVVPGDWVIDDTQRGTMTRLTAADQKAAIKIYMQPLDGISASDYLHYSNKKILEQQYGVTLKACNWQSVNGIPAFRLMWERPRLYNVPDDLNLYREINLIFKDQLYTMILKTNAENFSRYNPVFDSILGSFQVQPVVPEYPQTEYPPLQDITIKGPTMQMNIPKDQMMWGIFHPLFHPNVFYPQAIESYQQYEQSLGHKFEFVMTYTEFYKPFPGQIVAETYGDSRMMMMTLAPVIDEGLSSVIIPNIVNGEFDAYLAEWARQVKAVENPIFVRFANEMNGDWDPWCAWFYSKDADLYIQAWQRIHRIFQEQGADNAIFVWNPHDRAFPDFKWNRAELYYPGADYVDWVGLTGYNNGTGFAGETWRDFNAIYYPVYTDYLRRYPGKPLIITEFACSELGGDKAAWIQQAMNYLRTYPYIRIAVWYDQTDRNRLYRIDSSPAAKEAFRQGLTKPYFLRGGVSPAPESKR